MLSPSRCCVRNSSRARWWRCGEESGAGWGGRVRGTRAHEEQARVESGVWGHAWELSSKCCARWAARTQGMSCSHRRAPGAPCGFPPVRSTSGTCTPAPHRRPAEAGSQTARSAQLRLPPARAPAWCTAKQHRAQQRGGSRMQPKRHSKAAAAPQVHACPACLPDGLDASQGQAVALEQAVAGGGGRPGTGRAPRSTRRAHPLPLRRQRRQEEVDRGVRAQQHIRRHTLAASHSQAACSHDQ